MPIYMDIYGGLVWIGDVRAEPGHPGKYLRSDRPGWRRFPRPRRKIAAESSPQRRRIGKKPIFMARTTGPGRTQGLQTAPVRGGTTGGRQP
jgi:hypothetical protein